MRRRSAYRRAGRPGEAGRCRGGWRRARRAAARSRPGRRPAGRRRARRPPAGPRTRRAMVLRAPVASGRNGCPAPSRPARDQAGDRRRRGGGRARDPLPADGRDRGGDPVHHGPARAVSPPPAGARRPGVHAAEVPHDARATARPGRPARRRAAPHAAGTRPARADARRAARADQRRSRRAVAGGPAPAAARVPRAVHPRAVAPPRDAARHGRAGARRGSQCAHVGREVRRRRRLCGQLVAVDGRPGPGAEHLAGAASRGRERRGPRHHAALRGASGMNGGPINVLFTSVGRRVELVRAFRAAYATLGLSGRILAVDVDPLAPALGECDDVFMVPRTDEPHYVSTLVELCARERVALILPLIDPDVPVLATHRDALDATGARTMVVPAEAAVIVADKRATADLFADHDVPAPECWTAEEAEAASDLAFPAFVKPRFGSASADAHVVADRAELRFWLERVHEPIVQERLPGPEITSDVLCLDDGRASAA